jgi:hypothetical protein
VTNIDLAVAIPKAWLALRCPSCFFWVPASGTRCQATAFFCQPAPGGWQGGRPEDATLYRQLGKNAGVIIMRPPTTRQVLAVARPRFEPALFSEPTVQSPRPVGSRRSPGSISARSRAARLGIPLFSSAMKPSRFGSGGSGVVIESGLQSGWPRDNNAGPRCAFAASKRIEVRRCNRCNAARQPWQIWRPWQSNPCMFLILKAYRGFESRTLDRGETRVRHAAQHEPA